MFMKKSFCRLVSSIMLFTIVLFPCSVFAEVKKITVIEEYSVGKSETLAVAKERAVYNAMQKAIERTGTYVASYSRVVNPLVSKDALNMLVSSITKVTDKKFDKIADKKTNNANGNFIKVTVICKFDTDDIQSMMNMLQDKTTENELKKAQLDDENFMEKITVLKQQLEKTKTIEWKQRLEGKIAQLEQSFQWFKIGYDYDEKQDYTNAMIAYGKVTELNPQDSSAYNNLGVISYSKGQYDLAIGEYSRAIELKPQDSIAYSNRGMAYRFNGQYDLAIGDYNKVLEFNSQDAMAYNNRGMAYSFKGQYDLAISDYNKMLEFDPQNAMAYNNRGMAYNLKGQYDLAVSDYNKAIELRPKDAKAYNNRGMAYHNNGQYDAAIMDYNKANELNPQFVLVYNNRGNAYSSKGQYDAAISEYNRAIELNPRDGMAYNNRGNVYRFKGQHDIAISEYNKAIKLNAKDSDAYYNRALVYEKLGNSSEAIKNYNLFIQYAPSTSLNIEKAKLKTIDLGGLKENAVQRQDCILFQFYQIV